MKLTLSVVQRHVRDLHVAVAAAAVVLAVPCYAAFSATESPSQRKKFPQNSPALVESWVGGQAVRVCAGVVGSRFLPLSHETRNSPQHYTTLCMNGTLQKTVWARKEVILTLW